MIDKFTIDKIHDTAQIVDVVSDFITLKKRGANYVGLCPFHNDTTPSFYVSPSKNICKCFVCDVGGTAVQFIMKHEQTSYYEALRYLAKKYFIEIKERELTSDEKQIQSDRESMMVVNAWALKFYSSRLYEHEEGRTIGLPYFAERGFREDIIRKFQLGYSLGKRNDFYQSALKQGFKEIYLLKTGLVYKRDDGSLVDGFFNRIIFPIHSLSGKVVAFGGRVLGKHDKIAKYINSPESEIYNKSNELYGIFFSKQAIIKADKCFFVEGYTDVISMHQTGVENVVASCGTSLTKGHIRLIRRFTNNITILYDGDTAGKQAAIRGIDMFLEEGMNVKIVLLPEGEDPDSFARSHNSFDFTLFIKEHEVDCIRFKAGLLLKEAGNDPMKRAKLIKEIMNSVALISDHIVRSVYIKECSQLLGEREQVLIDEVTSIRSRKKSAAQLQKEREQQDLPKIHPSQGATEDSQVQVGDISIATKDMRSVHTDIDQKETTDDHLPPRKQYLFKKYESALIRYVVRYGERILFDLKEDGETQALIKVAEYIRSELDADDIEIQMPVYKRILDEAVEQCKDDTFVALHYFLTHTDLEISELAANMISDKYQLSKYFQSPSETLKYPKLTKEQQKVMNEAQKREKEREKMERWIVQDIYELKNAYIKHEIEGINKQIKMFQSDEEKVMKLLKKRIELDEVKRLLSRKLGDRIVIGIGN